MRIASAVADESMPPLINTTLFPVVMGNHIRVHDVSGPAAVLAHAAIDDVEPGGGEARLGGDSGVRQPLSDEKRPVGG